jgi:putative membrane protein
MEVIMMHGWYGNGFGPGAYALGFPWGGLVMGLVMLGIAVLLVILIVRTTRNHRLGAGLPAPHALEILEERFAKGEIDAETFRAMKAELEGKR